MEDIQKVLIALGYVTEQQRNDVFQMLAEDGEIEHRLTMKQIKALAALRRSIQKGEKSDG